MNQTWCLTLFLSFVFLVEGSKLVRKFPKNEMPSNKSNKTTRIFGGDTAKENQFPYAVFVLIKDGSQLSSCTASLVKVDKVLLAAHCVSQNVIAANVLSVAGNPDVSEYLNFRRNAPFSQAANENALRIQERPANEIFRSELTNPNTLDHDIAILSVSKPFELAVNVQLIPIATDKLSERARCIILGWGLKEGNELSSILLFSNAAYVVPLESCKYKKSGSFLCLEKSRSGICQGDSGSPLVCNDKAYGVASHILATVENAACGTDIEEVYAELYDDKAWIDQKLGYALEKSEEIKPVTGTAAGLTFSLNAIAYLIGLTLFL